MDETKRMEAVTRLDDLREDLEADLLTCYFRNPLSRYMWLFHRSGEFHYDCQMHGPLTFPEQTERMLVKPWQRLTYRPTLSDRVRENLFDAKSFATREGVKSLIQICLPAAARRAVDHEADVVIWVNYRERRDRRTMQKLGRRVAGDLSALDGVLKFVSRQPMLTEAQAWRLRSILLRVQTKMGEILGFRAPKQCEELYQLIVNEAFEHLKPRRGDNVLCTLAEVNANNQVKVLALCSSGSRKFPARRTRAGIVEYVARTGQLYYVRDTRDYTRSARAAGPGDPRGVDPEARPEYVPADQRTRCQLACPLVVQSRVVGVLNLEATKANAYDAAQILVFLQFAVAAALAVRQGTLWRDVQAAIAHQHRALRVRAVSEAFVETRRAVAKALEYQAWIWDVEERKWYADPESEIPDPPREAGGYTAWVVKNRRPVALADLHFENGRPSFKPHTGWLDKSGLFVKEWTNEKRGRRGIPKDPNVHLTKGHDGTCTHLGFPIFESSEKSGRDRVRAVLWIRCKRYFTSMLMDDAWCLSLFCRNTSEVISALSAQEID